MKKIKNLKWIKWIINIKNILIYKKSFFISYMTVWQFIKFPVFPLFFLSNLFLTFLDTLPFPFFRWFFYFFIRTLSWQFDSCSKMAYLLTIYCQTPILTLFDTLTVDAGIIWYILKKPRICLLFCPFFQPLQLSNCQTRFFDTWHFLVWHFDTPICWMIYLLFLSALWLDSLTVDRKWRICLQFTVKPRFDTLWHFDSWRWNNMIYSEKTTYLLAFLPLLPAPPTVKLSNPFFWHLTLSRLTLDSLTVCRLTVDTLSMWFSFLSALCLDSLTISILTLDTLTLWQLQRK